jgi:hypothetical protein
MAEPLKRRKAVNLPPDLVREIDAYRGARRPIPSESAAIRDLLIRGLEALKEDERPRRPSGRPSGSGSARSALCHDARGDPDDPLRSCPGAARAR